MAYRRYSRYKRKYGRKGRTRYRRRYRRYRFRKRYYRGKYRRFPKSTETKVVSKVSGHYWNMSEALANLELGKLVFHPLRMVSIGGGTSDFYNIRIQAGTGLNQRIGAKIKPIKLRISGVMNYIGPLTSNGSVANPTNNANATLGMTLPMESPQAYQLRLIVYQVRGANTDYNVGQENYHPLGLLFIPNGQEVLTYEDNVARARALCLRSLLQHYYYDVGDLNFTQEELISNSGVGKMPFRLGIGPMMRVLYNRTWTLQSGYKTSVPFRIVTKVPRRLVYPESNSVAQGDGQIETNVRNAIFIAWILIPMSPQPTGKVTLNYNVEMFYTDS